MSSNDRAKNEPDQTENRTYHQNGQPERGAPHSGTGVPAPDTPGTDEPAEGDRQQGPPRSGLDSRRRGWYWHWNEIVTQYSPLIGLKGIGLLNSYIAWTDRRDNSPHRGYAFPSQQTEAAFYGEERSELITINKILVALDLVEIRKEMVQRTDEAGHNWRVPHNFYRVKDRSGGLTLTTADVIRVAELADRDKNVYRYLRRVFSPKFKPIDRDNVWHTILTEVAANPTWQRLTEKAAQQEARASARSRAGHKKRPERKQQTDENDEQLTSGHFDAESLANREQSGSAADSPATNVAEHDIGSTSDVDGGNSGYEAVADQTNNGSQRNEGGIDGQTNTGVPGYVEQSNTMYYQEPTTTTTTTTGDQCRNEEHRFDDSDQTNLLAIIDQPVEGIHQPSVSSHARQDPVSNQARGLDQWANAESGSDLRPGDLQSARGPDRLDQTERSAPDTGGAGPLGDPSPLVVSLFEAANNRQSTPLERVLLSELERDADPAAQAAGSSGADWVAAALREAVASGSSFVAPKRIREIVTRWSSEGRGAGGGSLMPVSAGSAENHRTGDAHSTGRSPALDDRHEVDARRWQAVLQRLRQSLDSDAFSRLFSSSSMLDISSTELSVRVESAAVADKLSRDYYLLVSRAVQREFRRPMVVHFVTESDDSPDLSSASEPTAEPILVTPTERERGRQLWRAAIDELRQSIPDSDLNRLHGVVPLGQNEDGELVLGMPNQFVEQLVGTRYRVRIESAVSSLLGFTLSIRPVPQDGWSVSDS